MEATKIVAPIAAQKTVAAAQTVVSRAVTTAQTTASSLGTMARAIAHAAPTVQCQFETAVERAPALTYTSDQGATLTRAKRGRAVLEDGVADAPTDVQSRKRRRPNHE